MWSPEDRLELAAEVLRLQERLHRLRCKNPQTEEAKRKNEADIEIAREQIRSSNINCTTTMNANEFLRFMDQPNIQTRIVEEFNSISLERDEVSHKSNQISCLPFVQYLRREKFNDEQNLKASFVDSYDIYRKFLSIKNPSQKNHDVYWQAVWDNQIPIVVMTCRLSDNIYQYWSPKERYTLVSKKFRVKTWKIAIFPYYTLTILTLSKTGPKVKQSHPIFHYQYTAWPRESFEHHPAAFVEFYNFVNKMYVHLKKQAVDQKFPPMLVHCLEDVGSSDVFCALDICANQLEATGIVSLPHTFEKMQQQKFGSFCRSDLYELSYYLVKEYLSKS